MIFCLQLCAVNKTNSLLQKAYPNDYESEFPLSSNLSLLLFYLENHPKQIDNCLDYIHKKIKLDLHRKYTPRIKVGFKIAIQIVKQCKDHIISFFRQVLKIIRDTFLIDSLVEISTSLFIELHIYWSHSETSKIFYPKVLKLVCDATRSDLEMYFSS